MSIMVILFSVLRKQVTNSREWVSFLSTDSKSQFYKKESSVLSCVYIFRFCHITVSYIHKEFPTSKIKRALENHEFGHPEGSGTYRSRKMWNYCQTRTSKTQGYECHNLKSQSHPPWTLGSVGKTISERTGNDKMIISCIVSRVWMSKWRDSKQVIYKVYRHQIGERIWDSKSTLLWYVRGRKYRIPTDRIIRTHFYTQL